MRTRDALKLGVNVRIDVEDVVTGDRRTIEAHNLVTLAGRDLICARLSDSLSATVDYLAVGTGSTAPASGDTALATEAYRSAITKTTLGSGVGTVTFQHYLGTGEANGYTLREAGLLNAASSGTLFARVIHDAISKSSAIAVTYTWEITVSAA